MQEKNDMCQMQTMQFYLLYTHFEHILELLNTRGLKCKSSRVDVPAVAYSSPYDLPSPFISIL